MANTDNRRVAAGVTSSPQTFPINMYETDGALVVVAPLPGVMLDDVDVDVEGQTMRIRAGERTPAEKDYIVHEWNYGPYEREVQLPGDFGGNIEASFGNGQLAVRVLKGNGIPTGKVPVKGN